MLETSRLQKTMMLQDRMKSPFGDSNDIVKLSDSISEPIVVKEEEKVERCAVCGSTEIYKHTNVPLCKKCANKRHNPYVRGGKKVGRNELCPCGSGKKYKKCCLS